MPETPLEDPVKIDSQKKSFGESVSAIFAKIYSILFSVFEFILRAIIAILTTVAKIIRSVGIAVGIIFAALALLLITIFYAADLPNSEKFQNFRENSFATLSDWVELEFAELRERAAFWRGDEIDSGVENAAEVSEIEIEPEVATENDSIESAELSENEEGASGKQE